MKKKGSFLYKLMKAVLPPVLRRLYRVRAEGLEDFPSEGPVIVAANHVSFMDSVWIPMCIARRVVFLAKAEYFQSWKTAWFFKALGMIPVERGGRSQDALQAGLEVLQSGGVLALYPEGTRSPDGRIYRGRTGVGRLVVRSGAPVVPIGLIGSREVMPKPARLPRLRGRVTVRFGKPMDFSGYVQDPKKSLGPSDGSVVRSITDEIMYEIISLAEQEYVDSFASTSGSTVAPGDFRLPSDEMLG